MTHYNFPLLFISPDSQCKTEGDCACSSSNHVPFQMPNVVGAPHIPDGTIQIPLDDEFSVFLPPHGQCGASVLNKEAISALRNFGTLPWESPLPITKPDPLLSGFLSQGLLEADLQPETSLQQSETLTAWIHITDRCNLNCSYCYLPHLHEDMSTETAHAVLRSIFRSSQMNQFRRIKLKYAGGEPLIRFPFIAQLHDHAKTYFEENGIQFSAVLLSNGILMTNEIARSLVSHEIAIMISLDGLGRYHDSQRPYTGGRGSFSKVAIGIETALANGLLPTISITVSAKNIDGLPALLNWVLQREMPFNLNFYRENDFSEKHRTLQYDEEKLIAGLMNALRVIESNLPRSFSLAQIIDRTNLFNAHTHACEAGENYLVFDQNGRTAKCQMLIREPFASTNDVDPLSVIRKDGVRLINLSVEKKAGCQTCEWKNWCAGGCPLTTYRTSGKYDQKSPNCRIYKAILPEILRLEGLRILKFGNRVL